MSENTMHNKIESEVRKNASEIKKRISAYESNASIFSCERANLVDEYENKWIGVHHGKVSASADSFEELAQKIREMGVPLEQTMIRHIDREHKTLIL